VRSSRSRSRRRARVPPRRRKKRVPCSPNSMRSLRSPRPARSDYRPYGALSASPQDQKCSVELIFAW
jgi:hypothetical protein